jgi:hypothetical protein
LHWQYGCNGLRARNNPPRQPEWLFDPQSILEQPHAQHRLPWLFAPLQTGAHSHGRIEYRLSAFVAPMRRRRQFLLASDNIAIVFIEFLRVFERFRIAAVFYIVQYASNNIMDI